MRKGINPVISLELLEIIAEMDHGGEIVLADAHHPGRTFCKTVVRAVGILVSDLFGGIISLCELNSDADTRVMMIELEGDILYSVVEESYMAAIRKLLPNASAVKRIDRFSFYGHVENLFAGVVNIELDKYCKSFSMNILRVV